MVDARDIDDDVGNVEGMLLFIVLVYIAVLSSLDTGST